MNDRIVICRLQTRKPFKKWKVSFDLCGKHIETTAHEYIKSAVVEVVKLAYPGCTNIHVEEEKQA